MAVRKTTKQPKRKATKPSPKNGEAPSVWDAIIERAHRLPPEADNLPRDLAARADDYLEGHVEP
jgi:hypothetical protein